MLRTRVRERTTLALWLSLSLSAGCSSETNDEPSQNRDRSGARDDGDTADDDADSEDEESEDSTSGAGSQAPDPKQDASSPRVDASGGAVRDAGPPSAAAPDARAPMKADAAGGGGTSPSGPPGASGPNDGDPSKPVVKVDGVTCGGSAGLGGIGGLGGIPVPGTANLKIGGRDVILTYPCNKHEGANVTFILNLHGTMPSEELKFYQHGYFAAHSLANTHNLIVATPKSVVSQWGNGDNGVDKPHLMEVIDYVYKNFAKFNITSMWVGGHSWGAMYAKRFVCEEALKEKVRGVIAMSGGATLAGASGGFGGGGAGLMPSANCGDYIGQIHTVGDMDSVAGLPDQSAVASKHGCGAKSAPRDLGNSQMLVEWPSCAKGWVHENITMGAHSHTTPINPEVVKHIVEKIKETEQR